MRSSPNFRHWNSTTFRPRRVALRCRCGRGSRDTAPTHGVNFLVDQNRSPRLAQLLREAGHDARPYLGRRLKRGGDDVLLDVALNRIVISRETDFGAFLALARQKHPRSSCPQPPSPKLQNIRPASFSNTSTTTRQQCRDVSSVSSSKTSCAARRLDVHATSCSGPTHGG